MKTALIRRQKALVLYTIAALTWSWCALATAQAYPSKPIKLVVPFAAGGTADLAARVVAEAMGQKLVQPLVIDNKAGAGDGWLFAVSPIERTAPSGGSD